MGYVDIDIVAYDRGAIYRQLSTLLEAGLSPGDSFGTMARECRGYRQRAFEAIMQAVWRGKRISLAMERFPRLFPKYHCMLITEGETTGRIDLTLCRMADMAEHEWELRRQMQTEISRSGFTFLIALPLALAILPAGGPEAMIVGGVLIALFIAIVLLGCLMMQLPSGGRSWATMIAARIPAFDSLSQKLTIVYFARSLALLYAGGVPLGQALRCAASVTGDPRMVGSAQIAISRTESGH